MQSPWIVSDDGTITGPYDNTGRRAALGHVLENPADPLPWRYSLDGIHCIGTEPHFTTREEAVEAALKQCAEVFGEDGDPDKLAIDLIVEAFFADRPLNHAITPQFVDEIQRRRPELHDHIADAVARMSDAVRRAA